ncbi:MAG TPA: methylamine dehydrogenase accessory protein MauD [Phenylobacterium sp.]|uniref:methylamine dehydrogenase accessory protein MauD n=1 Tax=Phenylobacterium sp. TaxID=1871053 RepID=UPI002B497752|nr:methylamine dehydrogenase accessory protein MauD [Phenylobacterium sp.]HKR87127.1 methylamine dehydrogenase accessory protein MauD [Phenylobacterium sp.]
MIAALTGALLLQWVVLIGLIVVVIALLRQVGMLHERLGPVGALTLPGGPKVGEPAPRFDLAAIDGRQVSLGGPSEASTLLFFLSPGCPVCKALVPALKSIAKEHGPTLRLVLASDGEPEAQQQMVTEHGLEKFPLVLSTALGLAHQVSKLPHAVLIDAAGQIVAKGLVNNREHLESLFEAQRQGVASLQEFRQRKVLAFGG